MAAAEGDVDAARRAQQVAALLLAHELGEPVTPKPMLTTHPAA